MSRTLSEKRLLKQLKIDDFRQLSKDTVMRFASSIHKMDPEVAKKAIEQFPNFAQSVKDGLGEYKEVALSILKSSDEDHNTLLRMIDEEQKQLLKMLDTDELTLDEKFRILDELKELQERVERENKEMRLYRLKVAGSVMVAVVAAFATVATVLGGNSEIAQYDNDDDYDDDDIV